MPTKAQELLDTLDVDPSMRNFSAAAYGADSNYGNKAQRKHVFPKLISEY